MNKTNFPNSEAFNNFLLKLGSNPEKEFLHLRQILIRFFLYRGFYEAEDLADDVILRVITRIGKDPDYILDLKAYTRTVALNLLRENIREAKKDEVLKKEFYIEQNNRDLRIDESEDPKYSCLRQCLQKIDPRDKELLLSYYSSDKKEKKNLIGEDSSASAVRVRVFRLKIKLQKCIQGCLEKEKM